MKFWKQNSFVIWIDLDLNLNIYNIKYDFGNVDLWIWFVNLRFYILKLIIMHIYIIIDKYKKTNNL